MTIMSKKSRSMAAGAALLATFAAVAPVTTAYAAQPATTAAAHTQQSGQHAQDILQPQPVDGGYDYIRFDAQTAAEHPFANPTDTAYDNAGSHIVVLNFMDLSERGAPSSDKQREVLVKSLKALGPMSTGRRLALVDIVVRDADGGPTPYMTDYRLFYDTNTLGSNGVKEQTAILPYGLVMGSQLSENGDVRLFDFALMKGVERDADRVENAKGIFGKIYVTVKESNQ